MRTRDITERQILDVVETLVAKSLQGYAGSVKIGWVTKDSIAFELMRIYPALADDVKDMKVPGYGYRHMRLEDALARRIDPKLKRMAERGILVDGGGRAGKPFVNANGHTQKHNWRGQKLYTTPERHAQYLGAGEVYEAKVEAAKGEWRATVMHATSHGLEISGTANNTKVVMDRDDFERLLKRLDQYAEIDETFL